MHNVQRNKDKNDRRYSIPKVYIWWKRNKWLEIHIPEAGLWKILSVVRWIKYKLRTTSGNQKPEWQYNITEKKKYKILQTRILYPVKSSRYTDFKNTFLVYTGERIFPSRSALWEMLKEILPAEGKWHQIESRIYTKEMSTRMVTLWETYS